MDKVFDLTMYGRSLLNTRILIPESVKSCLHTLIHTYTPDRNKDKNTSNFYL